MLESKDQSILREKAASRRQKIINEWKEMSPDVFDAYAEDRETFRNLNSQIVQETFKNCSRPGDEKIIEVGAGSGQLSHLVSSHTKAKIVSTDLNYNFSSINKRKNPGMSVLVAEAELLPFRDNSADIVTGFSVLDVLPSIEGAIKEIKRVLKNKGRFIHFLDLAHDDFFENDFLPPETLIFPNPLRLERSNHPNNLDYQLPYAIAQSKEVETVLAGMNKYHWLYNHLFDYLKDPAKEYRRMKESHSEIFWDMVLTLKKQGLSLVPFDYPLVFQQRIQEIFERNGFEMLENGQKTKQETVERGKISIKFPKGNNFLQKRCEMLRSEKIKGIPEGMVKLESSLHVFIAEKK